MKAYSYDLGVIELRFIRIMNTNAEDIFPITLKCKVSNLMNNMGAQLHKKKCKSRGFIVAD